VAMLSLALLAAALGLEPRSCSLGTALTASGVVSPLGRVPPSDPVYSFSVSVGHTAA